MRPARSARRPGSRSRGRSLGVLVIGLAIVAACRSSGSRPTRSPGTRRVAVPAPSPSPGAPIAARPRSLTPPGLAAPVELPPPVEGLLTIQPRRFRHTSVRGDFRLYRTTAGILAAWKTRLSARSLDGKLQWQLDDQGRAVAISADGKKIVTNNDAGKLLVLDAATGAPFGAAIQLGGHDDFDRPHVWISAFAWLPDGKHIVALDSRHAYVLHGDGTFERELPIQCKEECFFTAAVALSNDQVLVTSSSSSWAGQLLRVAMADGKTVAAADYYGHDPDLSADGRVFVTEDPDGVTLFDTASLKPRWSAAMPGYSGVRAASWSEGSSEEWKSMPKLSPDGTYVAVNDHAGRLWLLDARDGKPRIAYPTDLVNYVEDVMWLEDGTLIVLDNAGHVARIAGTPARVVWAEMDAPDTTRWDGP